MSFGKISPQQGLALVGLGSALRGEDPTRAVLSAKKAADDIKRNQAVQQLLKTNPSLANIYNLFGEKGLQLQYSNQIKTQQDITALKNAGFDDGEISKIIAGLSVKDVLEERERQDQVKSQRSVEELENIVNPPLTEGEEGEEGDENVQFNFVNEGLKNIDEAFGAFDTLQQGIGQALGPVFGTVFEDTQKAVAARNVLNERIREKFVNQYSGRPSVYLNQRIDALLPQSTYMTEREAAYRYGQVKNVMQEGANEIKSKLNSDLYEGDERLEVENNYIQILNIIKDIDLALSALPQEKADTKIVDDQTGQPLNQKGRFDSIYTEGE